MRLRIILLALLVFVAVPAFGQETAKPPMDLAVYPGAETIMEVNLTNEDILPMAKAMIPLMGDRLGKLAEIVQPEDIAAIFKDVTRLEFLQLEVNKAGVAEKDLINFYSNKLPEGQWNKLFYQSGSESGTVSIYAKNGMSGIYGFRIRTISSDNKPVKRIDIIKSEGKIDFVKILTLAGQYFQSAKAK